MADAPFLPPEEEEEDFLDQFEPGRFPGLEKQREELTAPIDESKVVPSKTRALLQSGNPIVDREKVDSFEFGGRDSEEIFDRIESSFGGPGASPGTGFFPGVARGLAFNRVGEEPRGTSGQVGNMAGIVGNVLLQTLLLRRAFGVGSSASAMKNVAGEAFAGLAADATYLSLDPTEDDALTYGVMLGANLTLPVLSHLVFPSKGLSGVFDDTTDIVSKESIDGAGAGTTIDNTGEGLIQKLGGKVEADELVTAESAKNKINFRSGFDHSDVRRRNVEIKTQAEADIVHTNQITKRISQRYDELHNEYIKTNDNILNVTDKKLYMQTGKAIRKEVETFLKGKTLSDEQQLLLLNKFDELGNNRDLWNAFNDAFTSNKWKTGPNGITLKAWTRQVNRLVRKVEAMSENRMLGLPAKATKAQRSSVLKKLRKASETHIKKMANDSTIRTNVSSVKLALKSITDDPASTAVSQGFTKTKEFNQDFVKSLAFLSRVEDPILRKEAAFSVYEQLNKHADKINKTIRQSLGIALKSTRQDEIEAEVIERLLSSGNKIDPQDFETIRPKLARYIVRELESRSIVPQDNAKLSVHLAELDKKIAKAKGGPATKALAEERQALVGQALRDVVSNPVAIQQLTDSIGSKQLANAVDVFYASAGDKTAAARLLVRRNQGLVDMDARAASVDLRNNRRPNLSAGEPPISTTDEFGTGTPGSAFETDVSDISPIRRLLGTLEVSVEKSLRETNNPHAVALFKDMKAWLERAFTARNSFLGEVNDFGKLRLQPFYQYAKSLGEDGEKQVYDIIDRVARKSDDLLDEGHSVSEVNAVIKEMVSGQDGKIKTGYNMFREITDNLHTNINVAIQKHNDLVSQGLRKGNHVELLDYRPGYVPYFYDGAYMLRVTNGKHVFTQPVNDRKHAVEVLQNLYKGGNIQGKVTLEPRFLDEMEDAINFLEPQHSLDDVFGIDGSRLNGLFDNNELSTKNLHRVFWGNKLQRTLSLADHRLATEKAMDVSARLSFKFKHYFPIAQEGNLLVRRSEEMGLHNYANAIKTYGDDLLGRSRNTEKEVEQWVRRTMDMITDKVPGSRAVLESMGINQRGRVVRGVSNGLTFLGRLTALGYNPASAIVQWFILPTNVAPVIGFRNIVFGMKALGKVKNTEQFSALMEKAGLHINPANIGMAERMDLPKALTSRAQRTRNFIDWTSMYMFNGSENTIRAATILGARKMGKDLAKKLANRSAKTWQEEMLEDIATTLGKRVDDSEVLDNFAVKLMKRTNFDFDVTGLGELARNPLTKPFAQFKTYFFKEFEFLFGGGVPLTNKERFMSLGMFAALGGAFGLPFADEADKYATAIFGVSPKLFVHEHMPEIFAAGLPTMFGMDLSSKTNPGSLTRAFAPSGIVGVFPGKLWQQYKAYSNRNIGALGAIAGLSSTIKAAGNALEYTSTGRLSDRYGQTIAGEGDLNPFQVFGMGIGFSPKSVSYAMQASHIGHVLDKRTQARDRAAIRDYLEAIADGDRREADEIRRESGISAAQIKSAMQKRRASVYDNVRDGINKKNRDKVEPLIEDL